MINLNNIRAHNAIKLIKDYQGLNPYLKKIKLDCLSGKVNLTENQLTYIINFHQSEPYLINRIIEITEYLGLELQRINELTFTPKKILVEYLLADTDKSFHVFGKLTTRQKESKMYWLPKNQVIDDIYFEDINIDVDFTQYDNVLSKYKKSLYTHQKDGVKFIVPRNGIILADDMGLGKSITTIVSALEVNAKKILVICPASAKINWKREINTFCDDVTIVDSKKWSDAKFTIINFDILKNFHTLIEDTNNLDINNIKKDIVNAGFDLCIVDEAHLLKDNDSIRGKIVSELSNVFNIPKFWLLTGTPVANKPMDFYNLLKIIKSPIANDWVYFAKRYCEGKNFFKTLKSGKKKKIWLTDGASNLDELALKCKNILIRRLKSETLDMPDKTVIPMYYQLSNEETLEYENLWEQYLEKRLLAGKKNGRLDKDLGELILLRQFTAIKMIPNTIDLVETAISSGKKVIIFTSFTEELELLYSHFSKIAVKHNGSMSDKQKQLSVDEFQNNNDVRVFIGNIRSAGVAITLTKATVTVFNSLEWVPGWLEQCEDRSYRIGQNENVNIYYQLFEDTISVRIWETLKYKQEIIDTLLDNKDNTNNLINKILEND